MYKPIPFKEILEEKKFWFSIIFPFRFVFMVPYAFFVGQIPEGQEIWHWEVKANVVWHASVEEGIWCWHHRWGIYNSLGDFRGDSFIDNLIHIPFSHLFNWFHSSFSLVLIFVPFYCRILNSRNSRKSCNIIPTGIMEWIKMDDQCTLRGWAK